MKEFVDKLIKRLEEETIALEDNYGDLVECIPKEIAISIVNQLAEECKQKPLQSNDLMIVSSLPSLYPLQDFEEEAVHRVVAKNATVGGWIPCSEKMPADCGEDWVLVQIKEKNNGYLWIPEVGEHRKDGWWLMNMDDDPLGSAFEVIAWQPLPAPYQPKGE